MPSEREALLALSVPANTGFCNTEYRTFDLEHLPVVLSLKNLFVSFDVRDIAFVFHAVDFHCYILKKNIVQPRVYLRK